jgi:hypothetical protein
MYSGTSRRSAPNAIDSAIMLSAMEDLKVIGTIFGARMESSSAGDTVFTLIPHHDCVTCEKTVASLHTLDDAKLAAEVRKDTYNSGRR